MKDSFVLHFNFGNEIFLPELKGKNFSRAFGVETDDKKDFQKSFEDKRVSS